jgi:hypothetical protein
VSDNNSDKLPTSGEFFYYFGLATVNSSMHHQKPDWKGYGQKGNEFCKKMYTLAHDFDNIITILHKIYFLTFQWQNNLLTEEHWRAYVKTDIQSFHTELRSVCDSIAKALQTSATKSGQVISSFEDLKTFCTKHREKANIQIGNQLVELIVDTDWFAESRHFRDNIIHKERDLEVAYEQDGDLVGILFRTVFSNTPDNIYNGPKEFDIGNAGWLRLEPYAGYYVGRLWHFLNEMCRLTGERLELKKSGFSWVNPRLPRTLEFISQAIESLEQGGATHMNNGSQ